MCVWSHPIATEWRHGDEGCGKEISQDDRVGAVVDNSREGERAEGTEKLEQGTKMWEKGLWHVDKSCPSLPCT